MDKAATRLDLIRAGFQGSELLLRQGANTLGVLRGGRDSRIYLTGGQSFYVRAEPDGGLSMIEESGFRNGHFLPGKGIQYLGTHFRIVADPSCPEWILLEGVSGRVARFHPDHIEHFPAAIDPAFLLFSAWAIEISKKKMLESTWFGD